MYHYTVLIYCLVYVYFGNLASAVTPERPQTVEDRFKLLNGNSIPYIGFGTFMVEGDDYIFRVLDYALAAGYRLIDTAQAYDNEESIGKALKVLLPKYNLTREDIFITSKLRPGRLGEDVRANIESSLKKLDSKYLDLYLIHFPGNLAEAAERTKNDSVLRDESWQEFVKAKNDGLVKNIGVANYIPRHLRELINNDHGIKPVVNQVELHPGYHQAELLELCEKEGISLQAYFSLGGTAKKEVLMNRPEVVKIAEKLKKTPAQVLLRWALQHNVGIIPKASSESHVKENIDLNFIIPNEDMKTLFSFEQKRLGRDTTVIL